MIIIRHMRNSEIERIAEVDRSEYITKNYINDNGSLETRDVDWHVPPWSADGEGVHSVRAKIEEWRPLLDDGGAMFGAFDEEHLVGFGIYRPNLSENTAQLAALYVSNGYRNQGIGALLAGEVAQQARADGARKLYVSATPTVSTVHFYMGQGFALTRKINRRLFDLEPRDIHVIKNL
ncbi:MAG: GNAT family N-acetyltransferase [Candidatus Abyssobacteria bacterium SURF_5]|uniref:GNAT family N-acetyltransferase n=1 Tax=Abyssobacteria bacterium (strain SURF_5) TaxID=2093360 RepID=A0A3A4NPP3_ABYX5|nr:MAG: GNAT family N-acetyltransferase [Candidatus Abyssubacteria bacterium SURF_5]